MAKIPTPTKAQFEVLKLMLIPNATLTSRAYGSAIRGKTDISDNAYITHIRRSTTDAMVKRGWLEKNRFLHQSSDLLITEAGKMVYLAEIHKTHPGVTWESELEAADQAIEQLREKRKSNKIVVDVVRDTGLDHYAFIHRTTSNQIGINITITTRSEISVWFDVKGVMNVAELSKFNELIWAATSYAARAKVEMIRRQNGEDHAAIDLQ